MKSEGQAGTYVGGSEGIPVPRFDDERRTPRPPTKPKPTGLDWSKHRAPDAAPEPQAGAEPTRKKCRGCSRRPLIADLVSGLCRVCRFTIEERFGDRPTLTETLDEMEQTDPVVRTAGKRLDETIARITSPDDYIKPPTEGKQGKPTPRSSAPRQESTSSTTGRAPVAGPSTDKKDPSTAPEMRPTAVDGPSHQGGKRQPPARRSIAILVDVHANLLAELARLQETIALVEAELLGGPTTITETGEPAAGPVDDGPPTAAKIRAWAWANGYECPTKGRLPHHVAAAYAESHQ